MCHQNATYRTAAHCFHILHVKTHFLQTITHRERSQSVYHFSIPAVKKTNPHFLLTIKQIDQVLVNHFSIPAVKKTNPHFLLTITQSE
jgi:hypothetical protein